MKRIPPNKGLVAFPHTVHVRLAPEQYTWLKKSHRDISRFLRGVIADAAAGCPWIPPRDTRLTRKPRKRTTRKSA